MKTEIALSAEAEIVKTEVDGYIKMFEEAIYQEVDSSEPNSCMEYLASRISLSALAPRMMECAVYVYNFAKGQVAEEVMANPILLGAKSDIQRNYVAGRLAPYEAFYARVEESIKKLDKSIDGLRTIISYNGKAIEKGI